MADLTLRHRIYSTLAGTGRAPSLPTVAGWLHDTTPDHRVARQALRELHDAHQIVLEDNGRSESIRMALPFSAIPTDHRVEAADRSWWANCAWDALAIPAALDIDARIDARWLDVDAPVELAVVDGRLTGGDGFLHFTVPARRWWDDIVET